MNSVASVQKTTNRISAFPIDGFGSFKDIMDSKHGGHGVWVPKQRTGEIFRDAQSQDRAFSYAVMLLEKKGDRYAVCSGAKDIAEAASTLQEREVAIKMLTATIKSQLENKQSTGFYFADVVSSAST
ncbi:MAG: hypothetical protein ABIF01_02870, partial [Candidatus Micrarchaeota archaeon]